MGLDCLQLHDNLALPLVPIVQGIGLRGMPFSTRRRDELITEVEARLRVHETNLAMAGIEHLSSPKQLSAQLERKGLPLTKMTDKQSQFKTDLDVLRRIHHQFNESRSTPTFPWLPWLIEWKKLDKARANLLSLVPCNDGFIRTSLRTDTRTARYRSSAFRKSKAKGWCPHCEEFGYCGANLQNLAADDEQTGVAIKSVFVPRPGWSLFEIDMKLFEIIIMAYRSDCQLLLDRMLDESLDLHTIHAQILYPDVEITKQRRTSAKNFFYAWRGRGGEVAIQIALAKRGFFVDQATIRQHMMRMDMEYPEVPAWNIWVDEELRRQERTMGEYRLVRNAFGRPRTLLGADPLKEALADEISATAADIMNFALIRLAKESPEFIPWICMQIHDSVVGHCPTPMMPTVARRIKEELESPVWLPPGWGNRIVSFPSDAKSSEESWAAMRPLDLREAA